MPSEMDNDSIFKNVPDQNGYITIKTDENIFAWGNLDEGNNILFYNLIFKI